MVTLEVDLEVAPMRATLSLRGEFDMAGEMAFESRLDEALAAGPATVVVDLGGLTFLDSTGLRALIRTHRRSEREGWQLVLTKPQHPVARVFELTRTTDFFQIAAQQPV